MKGIVVEINKKDAVILTDEGLFTKARNENFEIGQTVDLKKERKTVSKLFAGAVGVAAAFAVCTIGAFAYFTPTDYVSMDVNPSVEYSANMFDRILEAKAANDDGERILSDLHLNNMTIENAVKVTLEQMIADGFITDDPYNKVMITTSNKKQGKAEQLAAKLQLEIRTYFDSRKDVAAEVEAEAVGPEKVREAKELGVTAGKLKMVEKLQSSTSGAVSREEWLNMTMKEINKAIKENRKLEKYKPDKYDDDDDDDWADEDDEWDDDDSYKKSDKARFNGYDMLTLRQTGTDIDRQPDRKKNSKEYKNQDMEQKDSKHEQGIEKDRHDRFDDDDDDDDESGGNGRRGKINKQSEDEDSSEDDD